MYAVIETGGKQYRVEVGTELEVELLDAEPGATLNLERVLLVANGDTAAIGRPIVANASVAAEVLGRDRGDKVISFKYRPKARSRVKKGHRQELTLLRISDIVLDGKSAAADVEKANEARRAERAKMEEAARRQAAADAELAAKLAAEKPVKTEAKPPRARTGKADAGKGGAGDAKAGTKTAKTSATASGTTKSKPAAKKPSAAAKTDKSAPKRSTKKDA
jgi:large subunit ribosomal protein L21